MEKVKQQFDIELEKKKKCLKINKNNLDKKYVIVKYKIEMSHKHQLSKFKQIKDKLIDNQQIINQ